MTRSRPKAAFLNLLFSFLLVFCCGASRSAPPSAGNIVFLHENDPVPPNALLITELNLSAQTYADSCAWFELLLKGTRIAASNGGNLVKILRRNEHVGGGCDRLNIAVYRVDSPCNADKTFRWSPDRKLRWDDFQGGRRTGCGNQVVAETSCGISVETSLAPASARARIYVFNTFDKRQSWVRGEHAGAAVLRHEQGHWDLCELYTRKMQARFDAMTIRGARLDELVAAVYDQVETEYLQRQEAYERETRHGIENTAQLRWELMIASELARN